MQNEQVKTIIKIIPFVFILLFSKNNCYATEVSYPTISVDQLTEDEKQIDSLPETDESIYKEFTECGMTDAEGNELIYINEERHIFYDEKNDIYFDEHGTVSIDELVFLGIIKGVDDPVELKETKRMKFVFDVKFENFDIGESTIYDIFADIYGMPKIISEGESTTQYAHVLLSRENNFTSAVEFDCHDQTLQVIGNMIDDRTSTYDIKIDTEDYGYKQFNTDSQEYKVTFTVTLPEGSITDTNLAPTLSDMDKKYFDGSYAESRRAEIKESMEIDEKPDPIIQEKNSNIAGVIIIVIIIILIMGAVALYIWKKKIEED